jgi:hypothetical protein
MITPELIGYIRGELAKGRTREEIRAGLVSDKGWTEDDLSEAFRTVIPMQDSALPNPTTPTTPTTIITPDIKNKTKLSKRILENLIFIIIAISCVLSWYFYRPQIINFWNSGVESSQELSVNFWNSSEEFSVNSWNWLVNSFKKIFNIDQTANNLIAPQNNTIGEKTVKEIISVKDCGTTNSPDLKNPLTYGNNAVLNCLGDSALRCIDTRAILKDNLFPTIFQITKSKDVNGQDVCNFKLSYGVDSTLVDITGKKLANQYISCPVSIVKALDETKNPSLFTAPSMDNLGKYASQIYFYGTLGIFIENNIEKNKIQSLGCSGSFIDSMIASYNKMQSAKK